MTGESKEGQAVTKCTDWVKCYEEGGWVKLSPKGLEHFNHKPGWNDRLRASFLGKSEDHPELIVLRLRGEKRDREAHPKFFEPAP